MLKFDESYEVKDRGSRGPRTGTQVIRGHPKHLRSFPDFVRSPVGGAGRDRTDDLRLAKAALPQLSYSPVVRGVGGPKWIRTTDLTVISRAL